MTVQASWAAKSRRCQQCCLRFTGPGCSRRPTDGRWRFGQKVGLRAGRLFANSSSSGGAVEESRREGRYGGGNGCPAGFDCMPVGQCAHRARRQPSDRSLALRDLGGQKRLGRGRKQPVAVIRLVATAIGAAPALDDFIEVRVVR